MKRFRSHAPAKRSLETNVLVALSTFGVVPSVVILTVLETRSIQAGTPTAFWMMCGAALAVGVAARVVARSIAASTPAPSTLDDATLATLEMRALPGPMPHVTETLTDLGRFGGSLQVRTDLRKN